MSNHTELKSSNENFVNWLWKNNKINENNQVKAKIFVKQLFVVFALFFGLMWNMGLYTFNLKIEGEHSYVGSFILYLLVVWLVSCLCSWVISLVIDVFYEKQIEAVSGNYPRKRKYTCY